MEVRGPTAALISAATVLVLLLFFQSKRASELKMQQVVHQQQTLLSAQPLGDLSRGQRALGVYMDASVLPRPVAVGAGAGPPPDFFKTLDLLLERFAELEALQAEGGSDLEGHIANKEKLLGHLAGQPARRTRRPQLESYFLHMWYHRSRIRCVVETGFNGGHSALMARTLLPHVSLA